MAIIQQSVTWDEGKHIEGKYLLVYNEEVFREEIMQKGFGFLDFHYDFEDNQLRFTDTNCPKTLAVHQQEIITEVWQKIREIKNYLKSSDYQVRKNFIEVAHKQMSRDI